VQHGRRVISTRDWRSADAFWRSGLRDLEYLLARFGLPSGGSVHEIGCGPGRLLQHLQRRYEVVTANDICEPALEDCRAVVEPWVRLILGGPDSLEGLTGHSYDSVVSVATLQHVSDPSEVLAYVAQAARLLKTDGVAVLQLASASSRRRVQDWVVDGVRRIVALPTPGRGMPYGDHWRGSRPDDASLRQAAGGYGSEVRLVHDHLRTWLRMGPPGLGSA
jgi:SAM-dependent methyltransferase